MAAYRGLQGQDADDLVIEGEWDFVDKKLLEEVCAEAGVKVEEATSEPVVEALTDKLAEMDCADVISPAYDPSVEGMTDAMMWSLPQPGPDFTGLLSQCGDDPARKQRALHEIIEAWMRVAGPPARPTKGYHVRLVNRITQSEEEAHAHIKEVGDEDDGQTATYMIFSIFSGRMLEYASIERNTESADVRIWEIRKTPWQDTWEGMKKKYKKKTNPPLGYMCVRDRVVVDQFTAYFFGVLTDEPLPVRVGSYAAEFNADTGMPVSLEFDILTDGMTDEQYYAMRATMFQYATNAVTAREAAASYAAAMKEVIRKRRTETAAAMMAADTKKRLARRSRAAPADVVDLFTAVSKKAREEAERLKKERLEAEASGKEWCAEEPLEDELDEKDEVTPSIQEIAEID